MAVFALHRQLCGNGIRSTYVSSGSKPVVRVPQANVRTQSQGDVRMGRALFCASRGHFLYGLGPQYFRTSSRSSSSRNWRAKSCPGPKAS